MLTALFIVAAVIAAFWLIVQASGRGWPRAPIWQAGLRLGLILCLVRVPILWLALWLLQDSSGLRQTVAHIALVADAIVELSAARSWLNDPVKWRIGLTLLVLLSSLGLGQIAAYLGSKLQALLAMDDN